MTSRAVSLALTLRRLLFTPESRKTFQIGRVSALSCPIEERTMLLLEEIVEEVTNFLVDLNTVLDLL